jgi:polyhydroxybutyrate depolymerase
MSPTKPARILSGLGVLACLTVVALLGCFNSSGTLTTTATGGTTTVDTGATTATGGVADTGGTVASGGVGSGGRTTTGTGGRGSGGAATGGTVAGGRTGTGGAGTGGSAGTTTTPPSGAPIPSEGCSATPTTTSACPGTGNTPCTIDVSGTTREYYLNLPSGYDGKTPAPVVWEYHPLGGSAKQGITMYGLNSRLPKVIFVAPQGRTSGGNAGFPNTNGSDEAMTRAINAEIEAKYCIDKARYFATGFSYGGSMSYTAGCNMSDVFRAIGAAAGAPISGATCTSKKPARMVAVWATHGDADTALPITMAQPIIDSFVKNNGCTTTTQPVDPSPCVEYQGCAEGYPVVWCVRPGDPHAIPSFFGSAVAAFFLQL